MDKIIEIIKYIVLGIVQGVTEIFPISSSGHLIIFDKLLNVNISISDIFLLITNMGSFFALLFFFRKDVSSLINGTCRFLFRKDEARKEDFHYCLKLIIAVIPIGLIGLTIKIFNLDKHYEDLLTVGFALMVTGSLLFFIYKMRDINWDRVITFKRAFIIGLFQIFAVIPGISRSGITTSGGLLQKIELKKALKFSFLTYLIVSIPTSILGVIDAINNYEQINVLGYSLAFIMSFVFSLLAVRFLYHFVKVKNFVYFAVYCFVMGLLAIILSII